MLCLNGILQQRAIPVNYLCLYVSRVFFLSFLVFNFIKCLFVQVQNRADRETKAVLLMFLFILFEQSLWYMSPKMDEQSL